MKMTREKFKEHLMLYGAEIENWPEGVLADALLVKDHFDMAQLIAEQRRFDSELLENRGIEPASPELASRIIYAARNSVKSGDGSVLVWLQELLAVILPRPAYAIAVIFLLGMVIGFAVPVFLASHGENDVALQTYSDDDEAIL